VRRESLVHSSLRVHNPQHLTGRRVGIKERKQNGPVKCNLLILAARDNVINRGGLKEALEKVVRGEGGEARPGGRRLKRRERIHPFNRRVWKAENLLNPEKGGGTPNFRRNLRRRGKIG